MCGIGGIVSKKNKKINERLIDAMMSVIEHRGPDGMGKYINGSVALAHRRLAIIDLSENGIQPMQYRNKVITFNGEIYNYIEIREELKGLGYTFQTETDTEVLLAAYDKWGTKCETHLNGMWAFCIWDQEKEILFCSRDRFGIKPFYFADDIDHFAFASEIKQLLEIKKCHPELNREHFITFLVSGSLDYSNETMYKEIQQLKGGQHMIFSLNEKTYKIETYYDLKSSKQCHYNEQESIKRFRNIFFDSVRLRLRADVRVGSCLSGGLDSSSIVCVANKLLNKNQEKIEQHVISSCFENKEYDEQEYIDAVVKDTQAIIHKVFPDMNQLLEKLDQILWYMDEPFASTSIFAQWNVFEEASKQNIKVMLDGQGADEHLGGYTPFYNVLFTKYARKLKWKTLQKEMKESYSKRRKGENEGIGLPIIKTIVNACFPHSIRMVFSDIYHYFRSDTPYPQRYWLESKYRKIRHMYNEKDEKKYIYASISMGLSNLLHYEDRSSMAYSIESRVPFLDYRLVELMYHTPIEYKIQNGITKKILREGLKDVLPSQICNRYSKLGFVTPEDIWYKENFDIIKKELEQACDILSNYLVKEKVLSWFHRNYSRVEKGDSTLWRIICAAHWVKVFHVKV